MTVPLLLEHFDELISTAEDVEKLNTFILTLAVQGKLVAQNSKDESATELLQKLLDEKSALSLDTSTSIIQEDEKPFLLPDKWEWVRTEDICEYIQRGKSPQYSEIDKYPVVSQKCIQWTGFDLTKARFIDPKTITAYQAERFLQIGDLLWNSTGLGTLGRLNVCDTSIKQYECVVCDSHVTIVRPVKKFINSQYLYIWFASPFIQNEINNIATGSTKQTELNVAKIHKLVLPLPPLAEQQRIVARVEELFAQTRLLAEQLSHSRTELDRLNESALAHLLASETPEEFNERWCFIAEHFDLLTSAPEHIAPLRQSILELAVRGKLTRQEAEDSDIENYLQEIELERTRFSEEYGFKKDKPLPSIQPNEMRFDIPESWKWVRLNDICVKITDGFHETPIPTEEGYPYVLATHVKSKGIDFDNCFYVSEIDHKRVFAKATPRKGDVLVVSIGAGSATPAIIHVDFEFSFKNVAILNKASTINTKYLFYYLLAIKQSVFDEITRGGAQPYLSLKMLKNLVFPLAPLAEQQRIVECVEKLLNWCDALETQLKFAEGERMQLVESILSKVSAVSES